MMEGVTGEAASLAGHLKLSNLCWIYDSNRITIEGNTSLTFSEDVATRFIGYGWNVTHVGDANDLEILEKSFQGFLNTNDRPTLIIVDSHISYGAPHKQDTGAAHGEPLGEEEIKLTKKNYGWPEDAQFLVPEGVYDFFLKKESVNGVGRCGMTGLKKLRIIKKNIPSRRTISIKCSIENCPKGGIKICPTSQQMKRGWPPGSPPARC
jgi:transketolase